MRVHSVDEQTSCCIAYPVIHKGAHRLHRHIQSPEKAQHAKGQIAEIHPAENKTCGGEEKDTEQTYHRKQHYQRKRAFDKVLMHSDTVAYRYGKYVAEPCLRKIIGIFKLNDIFCVRVGIRLCQQCKIKSSAKISGRIGKIKAEWMVLFQYAFVLLIDLIIIIYQTKVLTLKVAAHLLKRDIPVLNNGLATFDLHSEPDIFCGYGQLILDIMQDTRKFSDKFDLVKSLVYWFIPFYSFPFAVVDRILSLKEHIRRFKEIIFIKQP